MSRLRIHAREQLKKAGLYDLDSDYDGMLGKDTEALIDVFASQGHSGMSAMMVRELFYKLSNFEEL